MRQIPLGVRGSFNLLVEPEHLANRFKDAMLPPVFATPVMIMVMENAALNAIKAYLDPGESAVGTAVNIRHLAATPAGRLVTLPASLQIRPGPQNLLKRLGMNPFYHPYGWSLDGRKWQAERTSPGQKPPKARKSRSISVMS